MTRYEWADSGHTADPYNASLDRPTHIFINIGACLFPLWDDLLLTSSFCQTPRVHRRQ